MKSINIEIKNDTTTMADHSHTRQKIVTLRRKGIKGTKSVVRKRDYRRSSTVGSLSVDNS